MNMRTIKNWRITFMSLVALSFAACSTQKDEPLQPLDDVMMQAFYWDVIAVGKNKNVSRHHDGVYLLSNVTQ